jgi:multicomponent Na+:H+ antiporter subunit F
MIAIIVAIGVLISLALTLPRLFAGPTLYDRVLAVNAAALKAALVAGALSMAMGQALWVDAALALAFAAFAVNVAVLKFFRMRSFQPPLVRASEDGP